jgi:hypothetical protein
MPATRIVPALLVGALVVASLTGCFPFRGAASAKASSCSSLSDAVETGDKSIHAGGTFADDPAGGRDRVDDYADGVDEAVERAADAEVKAAGGDLSDALRVLSDALQAYVDDPASDPAPIETAAADVDDRVNALADLCTGD